MSQLLDNFNISLHKALYILYLCLINDNDFDMFTIIWILQMYCIKGDIQTFKEVYFRYVDFCSFSLTQQ